MGPTGLQTPGSGDLSVERCACADSDCAALFGVFHAAVHIGAARHYTQAERKAWISRDTPGPGWPARLRAQTVFAARNGGQIVGFMAVEPDGHLDLAFVRPDWMGRGVAVMLHAWLLDWAEARGLPRLTTEASHLARSFLARQGWQVDRVETVTRDGQQIKRFCMTLNLKDKT